VRHAIPLALLLLAAVAAGAEDLPVAPRTIGPSPEMNWRPTVVADGAEFVVLWNATDRVHFARIRNQEEVVAAGAFDRSGYLLAAVAGPRGSVLAAFNNAEGVHLARIDRSGEVFITEKIASSVSSMAWNGSRLLVVTGEGQTLLLSETGSLRGHGATLRLAEGRSAAAARGQGFIVAWTERSTVVVATLTNSGALAREQVIPDRPVAEVAIGCADANTCLLLAAAGEPLHGQILGSAAPGSIVQISDDYVADLPAPVWDGQRFLVTWADMTFGSRSMRSVVRVSGFALDGTVTSIATIASPGFNREDPAIAYGGGEMVVVSRETTTCLGTGSQIVARSLVTDRDVRLTNGLSEQLAPAIFAGTSTALVAWIEAAGGWRVRARRYPFTAPAFDVSSGPVSSGPVIGTDGSGYLIAWREYDQEDDCRTVLRITAAGSGVMHTLARDVDAVQIVWNGSEYAVLWEQADPAQLFAMRVARDGQPIDTAPVALSSPEKEPDSYTSIDHEPAGLFWTGNGYLLVWRRSRSTYIPLYPDPPPQFDARATILTPQLLPAASQTIAPAYTLAAAMKGSVIVALWYVGNTLHAARLSPTGTVLEQRDLGITNVTPIRMIPTRTGYAILIYQEILFLRDDLSLAGRRPTAGWHAAIEEMGGDVVEVYEADGSVYFTLPVARRRRTVR
jgi:hypothetical protein